MQLEAYFDVFNYGKTSFEFVHVCASEFIQNEKTLWWLCTHEFYLYTKINKRTKTSSFEWIYYLIEDRNIFKKTVKYSQINVPENYLLHVHFHLFCKCFYVKQLFYSPVC